MKPPVRYSMLLTHGAAILLGGVTGKILLSDTTSPESAVENSVSASSRSIAMDAASAWLDRSLREVRAEKAKAETVKLTPLTNAELLKSSREAADAERKEYREEVDTIVKESVKFANEPDPAAAIRANMRADRWEDNHSLAIFQMWLDKDLDGAIAELWRNWKLQQDEKIPLLLERRFGQDWLIRQVADDTMPFRLRSELTGSLGRSLAWEGGLDSLLKQYESLADPALKLRLVSMFTWSWPLDDPLATARFLEGNLPVELREGLLDSWTPLSQFSIQNGSFPVGPATPPNYATRDWFASLCDALGPEILPEKLRDTSFHLTHDFVQRWPEPDSFVEAVSVLLQSGGTREKAVESAISSRVGAAISDGTDLIELYGEGQMSRSEFLSELVRRIPGTEEFPDALEREAWRRTSMTSHPQQVADWAAELSERGVGSALLPAGVGSGSIYGDPRIPERLSRYQIFSGGRSDNSLLEQVRDTQSYEWSRWRAVAPASADAWRNALPAGSPLREVLREREESDRKWKEAQ